MATNDTLIPNPYAWNKIANVLFLESPTGVGYSSCAASRNGSACVHNDTSTAQLNFDSLCRFLELFPEYHHRQFMIWGESYAGVYVPMLADLVYEGNLPLSFQGFAVGDPVVAMRYQDDAGYTKYNLDFARNRGFISTRLHDFLKAHCLENLSGSDGTTQSMPDYDYPGCTLAWRTYFLAVSGQGTYSQDSASGLPQGGFINPYDTYLPRGKDWENGLGEYLNSIPVQMALHATSAQRDALIPWTSHLDYTPQDINNLQGVIPIYQKLAGNLRNIVVYSGDTDPTLNFLGTEAAVAAVGLPLASGGAWRPWFYHETSAPLKLLMHKPPFWGSSLNYRPLPGSQLAGYVTTYTSGLSFVTIHGSGHMVPMYKPQVALHMFSRTVRGLDLAPPLNTDKLEDASDDAFYEEIMPDWVEEAQSPAFVGNALENRQQTLKARRRL